MRLLKRLTRKLGNSGKASQTGPRYVLSKKISQFYRIEDEISKGARVIVFDDQGNEELVKPGKPLHVKFTGRNGLVKIHRDVDKTKLKITCAEGGYIYIEKCRIIGRLDIHCDGDNGTVVIGQGSEIESARIMMRSEPDLEVIIGKKCLFSSNIVFRACDGHTIFSASDPTKVLNEPKFGIHIEDHVWINANVTILKDVVVPKNCIVGRDSLITNKNFAANSVLAGIPARTVRNDVNWSTKRVYEYKNALREKKEKQNG